MNGPLARFPVSDPTRIYRYRDGLYAADLLTAAIVHLDLLSWLAEHPTDFEGLCRAFDLKERPADVLVTLLAATGLAERRDGQIHATLLAREHLTGASPFNITSYFASLKDRPVVMDFLRVLRSDRPAHWGGESEGADWHTAMETEAFAESFTAAMDSRGLYLGMALADAVDLGGATRVLDIGGGSGVYACTLVTRHPQLVATVMEQAPVDRLAAARIAGRGCAGRVSVHTADMFGGNWPDGHDVHMFSNVLHDWDVPAIRQLLALSAAHLPPGGQILIHEAFINAEKTGPLPVAEYSALLMHSTRGKCYATSEFAALLQEAGFAGISCADTVADRGVISARLTRRS